MINLFLSKNRRSLGAATLIMTTVLLVLSTLIIIFAANYAVMQDKTSSNFQRNAQAQAAAEAGMEYGINYFKQNNATILGNVSGGFLQSFTNSLVTGVVLANNSVFSILFNNPIASNYTIIRITATGTNDDSSATRTITQEIGFGSMLINPPNLPLTSKGNVSISGNSNVTNLTSNSSIQAGGTASISGSGTTVIQSGIGSTAGHVNADIQQNSSGYSAMSNNDFFANFFGVSMNAIKNNVTNYYSSSTNRNYSSNLNGQSGTSIWIDQTGGSASISGNTTIGSLTNPVLLIVNGDFDMSGNILIYGMVYVIGQGSAQTDITGNVTIIGGLISGSNFSMTGNANVIYSQTVVNNVKNNSNMLYYAKIPGSWKDF